MKTSIICIALFIAGCGQPYENNFLHLNIIDTNELIINSAIQVTADINSVTRCEIFGANSTGIRRQVWLNEAEELPYGAVGIYDPSKDTITLLALLSDVPAYNDYIKNILMHELGHALGLEHVEGTVMAKQYDTSLSYEVALEQLNSLLQERKLNPCDLPGWIL